MATDLTYDRVSYYRPDRARWPTATRRQLTPSRRFRPWMAAVAVVAVAIAMLLLLPQLVSGGHDAHGGASAEQASPAQPGTDRSSALRIAVVGLLFGGWALAFTVGIWRRWRVTDDARSDYDNVSAPR